MRSSTTDQSSDLNSSVRDDRTRSQRTSRLANWACGTGTLLIALGLLGLDGWVYRASGLLNHPGPPDPSDFYHRTMWFWDLCRLPGHWVGGVIVYLAVALLHRGRWQTANIGLVAFLTAGAVAWTLRGLTGRVRPNMAPTHLTFRGPQFGFQIPAPVCFPSGEATAAFALAAAVAYLKPTAANAAFGVAAFTALARLVPGSHYFSDVIAGALVGSLVTTWLLRRLYGPQASLPAARDGPGAGEQRDPPKAVS